MENSMEIPQEIKIVLLCDLVVLLLGIWPKETILLFQRDNCTPIFQQQHSWKQPKCLSVGRMNRENVSCLCVCTHAHTNTMEYYSSLNLKKEILSFATRWMNLEHIMLMK